MATQTFKAAYDVLHQHAQTLGKQQNPNMDELLTVVTESIEAYKVCQDRIKAVEKVLEEVSSEVAMPLKTAACLPRQTPPECPAILGAGDKTIPFFRLLVQPQFSSALN